MQLNFKMNVLVRSSGLIARKTYIQKLQFDDNFQIDSRQTECLLVKFSHIEMFCLFL